MSFVSDVVVTLEFAAAVVCLLSAAVLLGAVIALVTPEHLNPAVQRLRGGSEDDRRFDRDAH